MVEAFFGADAYPDCHDIGRQNPKLPACSQGVAGVTAKLLDEPAHRRPVAGGDGLDALDLFARLFIPRNLNVCKAA